MRGLVIVCSCNRITDKQIVAARAANPPTCPFSPGRAYKSLGCTMKCGRCVSTVQALLKQSHETGCVATGESCRARPVEHPPATVYAIAAE